MVLRLKYRARTGGKSHCSERQNLKKKQCDQTADETAVCHPVRDSEHRKVGMGEIICKECARRKVKASGTESCCPHHEQQDLADNTNNDFFHKAKKSTDTIIFSKRNGFCENQLVRLDSFSLVPTTVRCVRRQDNLQVAVLKTERQIRKFQVVELPQKDRT